MSEKICYWCGEPATSAEHFPPKGIFPTSHRKNLLTVPSCDKHNSANSKTDERFRFLLHASEPSELAKDWYEEKTKRAIYREEERVFMEGIANSSMPINNVPGVGGAFIFEASIINDTIEKITRAGFFRYTGKISLGMEFRCFYTCFPDADTTYTGMAIKTLEFVKGDNMMIQGDAENPRVFDYKYRLNNNIFTTYLLFHEVQEFVGLLRLP
jgi:hypothetical protein